MVVARGAATRWVGALTLLAACSSQSPPTEQEIRDEFAAFTSTMKACAVDADCVFASIECPLGCSAAVNVASKERTEAKARELVRDYQSGGRSCAYGCPAEELRCEASRCEATPRK